jgi:uncharacterized protein (TIGR01777 family)
MKVVIAGGSGLIGRHLTASLAASGHSVAVVTREPERPLANGWPISWDDVPEAIHGADAVVNLAGTSIEHRWTMRAKKDILASRVATTEKLIAAIRAVKDPPRVFVAASGISYAGDTGDEVINESTPYASSFLARTCVVIEAAAAKAPIRSVSVRTAPVISRDSSVLHAMARPHRFFVGRVGSGRQWLPWIHVEDLVRIYRLAIEDDALRGPVNAVAPQQIRQRDVAREFGRVLHRPEFLPAPGFLVRLGVGEKADVILHSARATSRVLDGFEFRYRTFRAALEEALG